MCSQALHSTALLVVLLEKQDSYCGPVHSLTLLIILLFHLTKKKKYLKLPFREGCGSHTQTFFTTLDCTFWPKIPESELLDLQEDLRRTFMPYNAKTPLMRMART